MKIKSIKTKVINQEFITPLKVTFGLIKTMPTVIIRMDTTTGDYGYGEACPFGPVTGETLETVLTVIKQLEKVLIGQNPLEIDRIHGLMDHFIFGNTSAKAAIDIACYDLYAKQLGVPLYLALGGDDNKIESDHTISIDTIDNMINQVKEVVAEGFTMVKLKAGLDPKKDVEVLKAIREEFGDDLIIRMDPNQGWSTREAIKAINAMEPYNLDAIEQPTPYWDIDGLRMIRQETNVPLMADESVHDDKDAMKLIKQDAVDVLNIKLMKSSGLFKAMKINTIGEAAGVPCMIGCMGETVIGITAGAHLAAAKKNITRMDLDTLFLTKANPMINGGVQYTAGKGVLPQAPGLGIEIDDF